MKIITNNAVYVQKNDIVFLNQVNFTIPTSISMKVFGNDAIIDDDTKYELIKFDLPDEIEFFKSINWIIDYDEVKDLTNEEIITLAQNIEQDKIPIAQKFYSTSFTKTKEQMALLAQYKLLSFKIESLSWILWFKRGYRQIKMPNSTKFVQEKIFRKLIKTI